MEVNNKYQIGQKVYFMHNDKARCDEVKGMSFIVYRNSVHIVYMFQNSYPGMPENDVFETEAELKAFVFENISNEK